MDRYHYDLRSALHVPQTCRSLEPVHHGHRNIKDQRVRIKTKRCVNRLLPVCHRPDNFEHSTKLRIKVRQHSGMIVSE